MLAASKIAPLSDWSAVVDPTPPPELEAVVDAAATAVSILELATIADEAATTAVVSTADDETTAAADVATVATAFADDVDFLCPPCQKFLPPISRALMLKARDNKTVCVRSMVAICYFIRAGRRKGCVLDRPHLGKRRDLEKERLATINVGHEKRVYESAR
jgi:hypothetical protein